MLVQRLALASGPLNSVTSNEESKKIIKTLCLFDDLSLPFFSYNTILLSFFINEYLQVIYFISLLY